MDQFVIFSYHYYEYPAEHTVNRHYALVTKDYKLIHYYFALDYWELIDRQKDPQELKNYYDDPAYADIREELHKQLEEIRAKYGDSDELNQQYIDEFMPLVSRGEIFGVDTVKFKGIIDQWKSGK